MHRQPVKRAAALRISSAAALEARVGTISFTAQAQ
jgi:hypothetical protein